MPTAVRRMSRSRIRTLEPGVRVACAAGLVAVTMVAAQMLRARRKGGKGTRRKSINKIRRAK